MIFNATHRFCKIIEPPSQEEIYNCPHYFAMSYDQVKKSGAPTFLIKLLDQFPFDGRKNILQIRPQDFRQGNPPQRGAFWHLDDNVELMKPDGTTFDKYARDILDWHLMSITWGAGSKTEFADSPVELSTSAVAQEALVARSLPANHSIVSSEWNHLYEYTSRDLHRGDGKCHGGGLRLFIVAFDCSDIENQIRILPTLRQQDRK